MNRMCIIFVAFCVTGCSAANLAQRQCAGLGLSPGDAEYWSCIDREEMVVQQNRAVGAATMTQGAWMLQRPAPVYVIRGY